MALRHLGRRPEGFIEVDDFEDEMGQKYSFQAGDPMGEKLLAQAQPQGFDPMAGALASNDASPYADPVLPEPVGGPAAAFYDDESQLPPVKPPQAEAPKETYTNLTPKPPNKNWYAMPGQQGGQVPQLESLDIPMKSWAGHPGGWQNTSQTFVGDAGQDKKFVDRAQMITGEKMAADDAMQIAQANEIMQRQADAQSSMAAAEQQRLELESKLVEQQQYIERKMEPLNRHRQMLSSKPVDPNRIYDDNIGKQILTVLAVAFGAAGAASRGGGENYAATAITRMEERDIEEQLRSLKEGKTNVDHQQKELFDELRRAGNSPEQIKAMLGMVRKQQSVAALEGMAARRDAGALAPKYMQLAADKKQELLETEQSIVKEHGAKHTQTYQQAQAGGSAPDYAGAKRMLDLKLQQAKLKKAEAELVQGGDPTLIQRGQLAYQNSLEKNGVIEAEGLASKIDGLSDKMLRGKVDRFETKDSANMFSRIWHASADLVGGKGSAELIGKTPEERELARQMAQIRDLDYQIKTGAAVTKEDNVRLSQDFENINSFADMTRYKRNVHLAIERKKASVAAGHDPEAVRRREENYKTYQSNIDANQDPVPDHMPPR